MSFLAFIAIQSPSVDAKAIVMKVVQDFGLRAKVVHLAEEFGSNSLYGMDVSAKELLEVELLDNNFGDLESALLDPVGAFNCWERYQEIASEFGRSVEALGDDEEITRILLSDAREVCVERLLHVLTAELSCRPIVLNLDPDFAIRFGEVTEFVGWSAVRVGLWTNVALGDLSRGLRLRIDS